MKEHQEVLKKVMSLVIRVWEAENSAYNKSILHGDTMAAYDNMYY